MAVVSKQEIFLSNGVKFIKKVTYSKGTFHIQLPDQLCEDMNISDKGRIVSGASEDIVNKLFTHELAEWSKAKTVIEKIILFKAKFQGGLLKKEYRDKWDAGKYVPKSGTGNSSINSDPRFWEWFGADINWSETPDIGLMFAWGVYEKVTVLGRAINKFKSGRDILIRHRNSNEDLVEIAWTAEREAFFLALDEAFAEMIAKVYKSLGDLTPEKLALLADNTKRLTF